MWLHGEINVGAVAKATKSTSPRFCVPRASLKPIHFGHNISNSGRSVSLVLDKFYLDNN